MLKQFYKWGEQAANWFSDTASFGVPPSDADTNRFQSSFSLSKLSNALPLHFNHII